MGNAVPREIGARVKESRIAAHLTQSDVAGELGVSRQAVSKWERGASLPNVLEMRALGLLLGTSLDYLVYGIKTIPVSRYGVIGDVFRDREPQPVPVA